MNGLTHYDKDGKIIERGTFLNKDETAKITVVAIIGATAVIVGGISLLENLKLVFKNIGVKKERKEIIEKMTNLKEKIDKGGAKGYTKENIDEFVELNKKFIDTY